MLDQGQRSRLGLLLGLRLRLELGDRVAGVSYAPLSSAPLALYCDSVIRVLMSVCLSVCVWRMQILAIAAESRHLSPQQHALHHLALVPALSLHPHLRSARHAAVRRRVSPTLACLFLCQIMQSRLLGL